MTGDKSKFIELTMKEKGYVTYGDNNQGKILGVGKIGNSSKTIIDNVLYVEGLEHNLLSISQLSDRGNKVVFNAKECMIISNIDNSIKFTGHRVNNIYMVDLDDITSLLSNCLISKDHDIWLWHRRVAHINMNQLNKLVSKDLVIGLPKLKFKSEDTCEACKKCKQTKNSFTSKNVVSTTRPLELLHMDLFGPSQVKSFGGSYYALVIVDDFSRFTWTLFLALKSDTYKAFKKYAKLVQNQMNSKIVTIRSDHGGEFENYKFDRFCEKHGIEHQYSAPRTPEQNGVVERKNRVLEELTRTMLNESKIPSYFWADAVHTACHVMNRILLRPILKKTPYELYKGRKPNISYFHVFGCKCFILNNGKESLSKFDPKSNEGIFLGYSNHSKAYRVYNKRNLNVEESIHIKFDESSSKEKEKGMCDDLVGTLEDAYSKDQNE